MAAAMTVSMATAATAQIQFDWGGDTVSDSGKQTIKFSAPAKIGDIIVSFGDRKLYFITAPGIADAYPIAIPREQSRWEGITSVSQKRENPSWTPTPTMLAENPRLPRWVPGGHPMNPLGYRALYLGSSAYRIHGTDAPWTIGTAASKGCVRLFNKDVADLFPRVKVGAKVTVTWQTYLAGPAVADGPADGGEKTEKIEKTTAGAGFSNALFGGFADFEEPYQSPPKKQSASFTEDVKPEAKTPVRRSGSQKASSSAKATTTESAAAGSVEKTAAVEAVEPVRNTKRSSADKPLSADKTSSADRSSADKTSTEKRPSEKARKSAKLETGSVESGATRAIEPAPATKTISEDAASIAARAEAAAERAALAAERASAAAERALQHPKSVVE